MSKKLLFILVLPFLFAFSSLEEGIESKSYDFIGYKERMPVFYETISGNLLLMSNDKLETIGNFNNSKKPIFINDDLMVFEATSQGKRSLVLSKSDKEKEYPLQSKAFYIAGDNNQVYYTDIRSMSIWRATIDANENTNLKGFVSGFDNECLYFNREHNPDLIGANADVFKYDTNSQDKPLKVANNLSGEMTYVLPSGKYIFDYILYDGEYRPSITEVSTGKFIVLDVDDKYSDCYYSYQHEALVFYSSSTLKTKVVNIPNEINMTRE